MHGGSESEFLVSGDLIVICSFEQCDDLRYMDEENMGQTIVTTFGLLCDNKVNMFIVNAVSAFGM